MADYGFYTGRFGGDRVPEADFTRLLPAARDVLDTVRRRFTVTAPTPESEDLALCALIEELYDRREDDVLQASAGSVTLRYRENGSLFRRLVKRAGLYLDIYRGVKE